MRLIKVLFSGGFVPSVFFSYSHADEQLRDQLDKQLSLLKRQGFIDTWHDRRISAGAELAKSIDDRLEACEIILLLVSSDFLASDYCYDIEMTRAMERHAKGEAVVIPVILRPCLWQDAPFGKLMATPLDGKPVTQHADLDAAFLEIAQAIKQTVELLSKKTEAAPKSVSKPLSHESFAKSEEVTRLAPRSSNLRLTKKFSDQDKDEFLHATFDYIEKYFRNSLEEIKVRNDGIDGNVRRVSASRFTASIYRDGTAVVKCTIFVGGSFLATVFPTL